MRELKIFATVFEWAEEQGKQFVGRWGPDIIAIDERHAELLIDILEYHVVDLMVLVGEVDASDLIGTPLMPGAFDPLLN